MSKRFTWEAFSIEFIKSVCYSEKTRAALRPKYDFDNKEQLIPYMDRICHMPDDAFVRKYRSEIIDNFLAGSTHLVTVMRALEKNSYRGARVGTPDEMLSQLKLLNLTSTVLTLIKGELYRAGDKRIDDDAEFSIFGNPKTIDLTACVPDDIPMFPYQDEALGKLREHFIVKDHRAGVLVMPTGSGKTRVATRFLLESMVADGWQIIWLAHRAMLIEQTASSVYNFAGGILPAASPNKDVFKMVCVSGSHASVTATEKTDDVMIFSVQTLVRNLPYLQAVLGDKVMIIVDEAHHTLAKSYRHIISEIQKISKNVKLLGLTATPVRMTESDTAQLMKLFDNTIVYSIPMSDLIAKSYLSEPHYERVDTNIDFDTVITLDERKYIQKWGELSPETLERMADIAERNKIIADTYIKNRKRYGKTLIFALNSTHCISLCKEFRKRGVKCDYIYCAHSGNADKIARFQRGELEVLINIQILTEGSDVPDIQTVFLTRPTTSDVLLMQMIGRGMRGKSSKGTETVNIVDFHDIWGSFTNWLNPEFVINEIVYSEVEDGEHRKRAAKESIPWAAINDILREIHVSYAHGSRLSSHSSLPVGWYDVIDEDGNDTKVLVFESQISCYLNMWKHKKSTLDNPAYTGRDALHDWFRCFGLTPSAHDIQLILDTYRLTGEFPHLQQFSQRKAVDAAVVAERFRKENVGINDVHDLVSRIYDEHSDIINSIYGDRNEYIARVTGFLYFADGFPPLGMKVEELAEERHKLDLTPFHDLNALVAEVIDEMFDGAYGAVPPVNWTDLPYRSYFGIYYYRPEGNYILINCILNSVDVPREAIKYVIYHELLHRDNRLHNPAFRALEHKYPDWTEHERFLDFTFPQFDIEYAM